MARKILIVNSHSIYEDNSTGITIRSILSSMDKNSLLEVYYFPSNMIESTEKIDSIILDSKTKRLYSLINKFIKKDIKAKVNKKIVSNSKKKKKSLFKFLKFFVLGLDDYLPFNMRYNHEQLSIIDEYQPDIIYTLGSSIFPLELSLFFSERYNIPIVLHHMDNWRETKYNDLSMRPFKKRLKKSLNETESKMVHGLTISDSMAKYYNKLSGVEYLSLMHVVPKIKLSNLNEGETLHIVYAGGLHLERWKVLLNLQNVLKKLNNKGFSIKLLIYTKNSDRINFQDLFDDSLTIFNDYLPYDEVYKIYEKADLLIHVESFDEELIEFTKYSMSTKIPEYLSTGKPVICYAPGSLAVSQYIKENGCGFAVSTEDELYEIIEEISTNESLRKEVGERAVNLVRQKHSEGYKHEILTKVFNIN